MKLLKHPVVMMAMRLGVRAQRVASWRNIRRVFDPRSRRVLLLVQEYTQNGTGRYLDSICDMLQRHGCKIVVVQYVHQRGQISKFWDKDFFVERPIPDAPAPGAEQPDKLISSALLQFVRKLTDHIDFDMVVASYVFMSGALIAVPPSVPRLIIAYDVFTDRRQRLAMSRGISAPAGLPLTASQEARGLSRADLVIAITDHDRRFFVDRLKQPKVITLPFVPPPAPLKLRTVHGGGAPINVGFLGSAHQPNADAILAFVNECKDFSGFSLLIGGKVCDHLHDVELPEKVQLLGRQLSAKAFYKRCHLIINPDMFDSGQKVKTVEALAYGMPLICTSTAAAGLPTGSHYHQASSTRECVELVKEVAGDMSRLQLLQQESISLYRQFHSNYGDRIVGQLIGTVDSIRKAKANS
jgi:glycosyltransferase involved in cell wall biosynthesis